MPCICYVLVFDFAYKRGVVLVVAKRCCRFWVRDDDYDDNRVVIEMEMVKMLKIIVGWGVVPRMAPPPSQGDSTLRGREREKEREREMKREIERNGSYIHSFPIRG